MTEGRIDPERMLDMERSARRIGRRIGSSLPLNCSFVLIIAANGSAPESTYISNVGRPSAAKLLIEMGEVIARHLDTPTGNPAAMDPT